MATMDVDWVIKYAFDEKGQLRAVKYSWCSTNTKQLMQKSLRRWHSSSI